jgi:thiamine biosynthesis lipoprotein
MLKFRRRMRPQLGTFVEIAVPESCADADRAIDRAFERIAHVESLLNRHDPASELSALNRTEGAALVVHATSACMLRLARGLMRASDGVFNCTVAGEQYGSADDIKLHGRSVQLRPSLKLTLDGIAKGFAIDLAIKALKETGVASGAVNAGGDLKVFGDLTWPVYRRELASFELVGHLRNAAIATSQVFASENESFTGKIVGAQGESPVIGVWSVVAPSAWLADGLTKVASLTPEPLREQRIAELGGCLIRGAAQ